MESHSVCTQNLNKTGTESSVMEYFIRHTIVSINKEEEKDKRWNLRYACQAVSSHVFWEGP